MRLAGMILFLRGSPPAWRLFTLCCHGTARPYEMLANGRGAGISPPDGLVIDDVDDANAYLAPECARTRRSPSAQPSELIAA